MPYTYIRHNDICTASCLKNKVLEKHCEVQFWKLIQIFLTLILREDHSCQASEDQ